MSRPQARTQKTLRNFVTSLSECSDKILRSVVKWINCTLPQLEPFEFFLQFLENFDSKLIGYDAVHFRRYIRIIRGSYLVGLQLTYPKLGDGWFIRKVVNNIQGYKLTLLWKTKRNWWTPFWSLSLLFNVCVLKYVMN